MKKNSVLKQLTKSREFSLVIVLIVLCIVATIFSPSFLSPTNISQIFRNNALTMILSVGMLCVLLTGGIDISIASILAFSGMTVGMLLKYDVITNTFLLFVIGSAIGVGCGLLNGLIIAKGNVAPIISTMGFMYIWRGLAYVISNNEWASGADVVGYSDFGADGSMGPYIIIAAVFIIGFIVMKWTKFGRKIYAVGSNTEAARVSGINVDGVLIYTYVIMGFLSGLCGALSVSIYASAQCPFYIRKAVAGLLALQPEDIVVKQTTTGGAFGGKEHFPDVLCGPLLVAESVIHKPIKLVFDRTEDMLYSVKRHPSKITFRTALDKEGSILGIEGTIYYNCGAYLSSSYVVLQRGVFHANGVYDFPATYLKGVGVATNTFPSDAFRGFGAPQTLFAIETHLDHIARKFGFDPAEYKSRYFIKKDGETVTNGHIVEDVKLPEMMKKIEGCLHCGACMKKCPYGLNTPELLAKNYEDYKTFLK